VRSLQAPRVLLTGGAGFLGQAILRELCREEDSAVCRPSEIRLFDLEPAPTPSDLLSQSKAQVVSLVGDVCDYPSVLRACRDIDVVIHAASLVDWGQASPGRVDEVNVGGTRNVVNACLEAAVPALVYTSSMDVVCGNDPVVNADETTPFPRHFTNEYSRTKAAGEELVLAANGAAWTGQGAQGLPGCRLATCALRPCGMFGEGDPYHVTNVLRVVKEGKLSFRPGSGKAAFQHVYVGNVAHAHLLAVQNLLAGGEAAGEAYFITDDTPAIDFLDFMEPILEALGYSLPPRNRRMPYGVMLTVGAIMEAAAALCRPIRPFTPTLTRSSVRFVCHDHTFNGAKAARDLGYVPVYQEPESLERTIAYFRGVEASLPGA
jgi:cholest-5-ene-3beta,7alpha-diol 3beta-dehydrogenase